MIPDFFTSSLDDAIQEVAKRRGNPEAKDLMHRVEPSPYGGYRVRSYVAELYVDMLADGVPLPPIRGNYGEAA